MQHPVYGIHTVNALLKTHPDIIGEIQLVDHRSNPSLRLIHESAEVQGISVRAAGKKELDKLFSGANHQGVVAYCKTLPDWSESWLFSMIELAEKPVLLLILDGITDPHNLGACLRSANAFGVDAVIIPKDRSASITPTVRKVASGAAEITPLVTVTNLARSLKKLQTLGVWLIGLKAEAETALAHLEMTGAVGLILGSEGEGIRRLTAECCDFLGKIPMNGTVESLNVSVSAGVCLYEAARQRCAAKNVYF